MKIKIALAQLDIKFGQPVKNKQLIRNYVKEAARQGAIIVVFPEMWNTGYALSQLETLADFNGETTKALLSQLAHQYQINIVGGSVATQENGKFFNTTYIVNQDGELVASYRKVHLFGLMHEDEYLTAGDQENFFTLAGIPSASFICYDLRFPEWIRTVASRGAKILYFPAEWPLSRINQWKILLQARAIENQAYVIAVNRVGNDPENHFGGHSLVISPTGEVLVECDDQEKLVVTTLDLDKLKTVRGKIPVFSDRRPTLYH